MSRGLMEVLNFIGGQWIRPETAEYADVTDPATGIVLAKTPLGGGAEVDAAAKAARAAFPGWRSTPVQERIQFLFRLRALLRERLDEIAATITSECGKTLEESRAEMVRAIENVEVACGMPSLAKGEVVEDIAPGIDEIMLRQPVGVGATIAPFNFPGMIPFWFLPYALACGNTFVVKPSERVPLTMQLLFRLIEESGFPAGVVNLVNGAKDAANAVLDHPDIRAITFVGSTPTAKHVYSRAAANGKRVQAQAGAKNPVVVLPDADMEMATRIVADSAFGCAGQRCLAVSLAVTVGEARDVFTEMICDAASNRVVGPGSDPDVEMGPVISQFSKDRIEHLIAAGGSEGGTIPVDGRKAVIKGYEGGSFVRPTIISNPPVTGEVARTEIFGPVLSLIHVETADDAIQLVNTGVYGNQASLFTTSGAAARSFRSRAEVGNIGINIGVAAPMAFFPFSGWRESFFGDLHGQGMDAVEFFTQKKVVVERWPRQWSRKF